MIMSNFDSRLVTSREFLIFRFCVLFAFLYPPIAEAFKFWQLYDYFI